MYGFYAPSTTLFLPSLYSVLLCFITLFCAGLSHLYPHSHYPFIHRYFIPLKNTLARVSCVILARVMDAILARVMDAILARVMDAIHARVTEQPLYG